MKKLAILGFLIILLMFLNITSVQSTEGQSMELTLTKNKSSYNVGEEIYVNVNIKKLNGFSGINTFSAKKVYNSEILEYIGATVEDNWKVVGDSTNIVIRKMSGEDLAKGKICTLKFKVLKAENTSIQISEVDACNNDGDVYYEDNNVNSPLININIKSAKTNNNSNKANFNIGTILIVAGCIGLIAILIDIIIRKVHK